MVNRKAWPNPEVTPECARHGCNMSANPHNDDGLCAACERAEIERKRQQMRAALEDGRLGLWVQMDDHSREEWLDE
jgi:hypothetical protein